jgi:hypothetical protein
MVAQQAPPHLQVTIHSDVRRLLQQTARRYLQARGEALVKCPKGCEKACKQCIQAILNQPQP